jgi:hypothetical protein
MGYSTSPQTVRRILPDLIPLYQRRTQVWSDIDSPGTWAYKIREAFSIAKANPDMFPELADVAGKYQIVLGTKCVIARWVGVAPISTAKELVDALSETPPERQQTRTLVNPTFSQIIQAYIDQQSSQVPIYCKQVTLSNPEIEGLERWAKQIGWVIYLQGDTLSLRPSTKDVSL